MLVLNNITRIEGISKLLTVMTLQRTPIIIYGITFVVLFHLFTSP